MSVIGWNELLHRKDVAWCDAAARWSCRVCDHMIFLCDPPTVDAMGEIMRRHSHVRPGIKMMGRLKDGDTWRVDDVGRWKAAAADLGRMIALHGRGEAPLVAGIGFETAMNALNDGRATCDWHKMLLCFKPIADVLPRAWRLFVYPGIRGPAGSVYDKMAYTAMRALGDRGRLLLEVACLQSAKTLFAAHEWDRAVRAKQAGAPVYNVRLLRPEGRADACYEGYADTWTPRGAAELIRMARMADEHVCLWTGMRGMWLLELVERYL